MKTTENNKLIAEFWGMELGDDKTMYYDDAENLFPPTPIDELKFYVSWDWLRPVVIKIEQVCEGVPQELLNISLYSDINEVYNAVVEFIKQDKVDKTHQHLREILIKYNSPEYGDCIIDEICHLFDYPLTNDEN